MASNLNILPHIASPLAIFAKIANFAKIAIFAKIASLQGATFGIQFKSPEAGDFSPVSPFSPLHAGRFLPKSPISPKSLASKGPLLASNSNRQRLAIFCQFCHFHHCMHGDFCQNRQFRQNRHFRQNRQPPRATFGIQFKSPAAGDFSPVSPFSPLHAFLDISENVSTCHQQSYSFSKPIDYIMVIKTTWSCATYSF